MFVRIGMNVCQNMYECTQDKYGYKPLMKNEKLNVSESQAFTPTYLHTFLPAIMLFKYLHLYKCPSNFIYTCALPHIALHTNNQFSFPIKDKLSILALCSNLANF